MTSSAILGPLSNLHEMQAQLVESLTPEEAAHQYHPELGSLNWQFGQAVYQELHWLRLIVAGDDDLSKRVAHLFTPGKLTIEEQCSQLPPTDHLLNWAAEIRDDHLMRLANPATLPDHPLLANERLQWFLLQEQAKRYETMLLLLNQRSLQIDTSGYQVTQILKAAVPYWETKELSRGHYRVGARDLPSAYDNELPAQAVELTSFRIALDPVSNTEFLAFMEADGYQNPELWDETGRNWLKKHSINHPEYWRQEKTGNWYAMGVNGPSDLPPDEPISGINRHEAQAFANWISALGGKFEGAVLQHEYQSKPGRSQRLLSYRHGQGGILQARPSLLPGAGRTNRNTGTHSWWNVISTTFPTHAPTSKHEFSLLPATAISILSVVFGRTLSSIRAV
ncbi:formylglycine-generating enzyme family protein [endosymbiont of Lamellibrachia barhami]|uniref:formylglycine-generating enzyme family protein n=1 Tax=endosymbiont of Lamellibrachia barhami TaxID=205975 RepID=UPI0015AB5FFC|nr:SUMF1/EgtB/PvdO family nonheme iron enzyme [endosymbiont of Lamellibrachia barhami]